MFNWELGQASNILHAMLSHTGTPDRDSHSAIETIRI